MTRAGVIALWLVTVPMVALSLLYVRFLLDPGPDSDVGDALYLGTPVWAVTAALVVALVRARRSMN